MAESRFLENVLLCANTLPCVFDVAHGKHVTFAVCLLFAVCPTLCRALHLRHTAKAAFAVCPTYGTRQRLWHTAIRPFPVVILVKFVHKLRRNTVNCLVYLQPLTVPPQAWHTVCLDFIEGLPKSKGFDTILVVIDKFTKYGHFIPLSHPYSALSVAQLYMNNIYKLHGMPKMLVSYRDRVFTSALWQELFRLAETTLNMSSAYHPQTDGQTERLKQCLETYLRCLVQSCPSKWATWLPLAEFWYNTSFHSALGKTPFEVLYGHPPSHFGIVSTDACNVPDLQQWLIERSAMTELIQHNLQRAQQCMKHQEDKHRQEREFGVGDWVFVKL